MTQATLRKLARDYADGILEKEDYRKSRAELLEGILSGEIELQTNEYLPPVVPEKEEVLDITTDRPRTKENPDVEITQFGNVESSPASTPSPALDTAPEPVSSPSNDTDNKKLILLGGGAAAAVLVVILVIALISGGDDKSTKSTKEKSSNNVAATDTKSVQSANAPPGRGQKMIQEFLSAKNWSDTNINRFKIQWLALPEDIRAAATGTVQWGQLTNSIYKKLLEERALIGLGDDEAVLEKQRKLVSFAENIGISDSRISMPK